MFVEVRHGYVGAFSRKGDGDGPADPAVPTSHQGHLAPELCAGSCIRRHGFGARAHDNFATGPSLLVLSWRCLTVFLAISASVCEVPSTTCGRVSHQVGDVTSTICS